MPLDPLTAVVTGASGGIGRELVRGLLQAGATVLAVDMHDLSLESLKKQCDSGRLHCMAIDLAGGDSAGQVVAQALELMGRIDLLVLNAGIGRATYATDILDQPPRAWEVVPEHWRRFFDVNALAGILLANAAVPSMVERGSGRIVAVTTSLDSMLVGGTGPYGPSKAALEAYCAVLGAEVAPLGIDVNVLIPGGPVDTAMIPAAPGLERSALLPPSVMVAPLLWLAGPAARGTHLRRFRADRWVPGQEGDPIAWSGLMGQRRNPARSN